MSDERKMILTMLAEGKITSAEASKLLDALTISEGKPATAVHRAPRAPRPPRAPRGYRAPRIHRHRQASQAYAKAMAQIGLDNLSERELESLQNN